LRLWRLNANGSATLLGSFFAGANFWAGGLKTLKITAEEEGATTRLKCFIDDVERISVTDNTWDETNLAIGLATIDATTYVLTDNFNGGTIGGPPVPGSAGFLTARDIGDRLDSKIRGRLDCRTIRGRLGAKIDGPLVSTIEPDELGAKT